MTDAVQKDTRFYSPLYQEISRQGIKILIDPETPHWITTDARGADLMRLVDGKRHFGEIVNHYCKSQQVDWPVGWLHCRTFFEEVLRAGFISTTPFLKAPYPGRSEVLQLGHLSDLWLHVTNACNLSCEHCLVNSSPGGTPGGDTAFWLRMIDQGLALGVSRFFITGGEPFLREDIFEIIDRILEGNTSKTPELVILTNGMLFRGSHLKRLAAYDPARIQLQISLDGPTAEINNPIRGNGTFDATIHGIKEVISLGFSPTLTTVVNRANVDHVSGMAKLASSLGIQNLHFLLSHHRGRALGVKPLESPPNSKLLDVFKTTKSLCKEAGITFDNFDTLLAQLMGPPGVKVDLSNAAYASLCIYADGQVYPSAALAGIPELKMGNPDETSLEEVWRTAAMAKTIRKGTVQKKTKCKDCYLKYLCGGGDIEHTYLYSGQFLGEDPFSDFYEHWILESLFDVADAKARQNTASGYDRPIIYAAMGDGAVLEEAATGSTSTCGFEVALSRSVCVLSVDLDHSRRVVSDFYGGAADKPQPALCCPESYPLEDSDHIPQEVLDISYGCGSPVGLAGLTDGETMVDLGSGGGIDCFIAAKKVGISGRVVGIDMTDQMLREAHSAKKKVMENLGRFTKVSTNELLGRFSFDNEEIKLAFVAFSVADSKADVEVNEERLAEFFEENKENYKTDPQIKISFLSFSVEDERQQVEISDEDVTKYYEQNIDQYAVQEQRAARHILFKVSEEDSEDIRVEKLQAAENVLEKARAGEDFSSLASQYSEGPSAPKGGDLGAFGRGRMVKPFDDAVFAMAAGEISEIVETTFGYHIIKLEKIVPASIKSISEVRGAISTTLKNGRKFNKVC